MIHKLFRKQPVPISIQAGPFAGAKVFLNPANSKRKIFGLYEYSLNEWIKTKTKDKQFVLDVGANTGYDTYGFAHRLLANGQINPVVLAFEPTLCNELTTPKDWKEYKNCRIEIIDKYVGKYNDTCSITLDEVYSKYREILTGNGLIKIDIEGAEVDALLGAKTLLENPVHDWLIEIHGKELITTIADHFVSRKRPFLIKDIAPLPVLGPEKRSVYTCWLVTI